MNNKRVFVLDVDGVITPGNFFYSRDGKFMKEFGADDFDMLNEVRKHMLVQFITGDNKGYDISERRLYHDCHYTLDLVPTEPWERWQWISSEFKGYDVIFMGDGCKDFLALENAQYSITTCEALDYVKDIADYVTKRKGGRRAVAEACLQILRKYKLDFFLTEYDNRQFQKDYLCTLNS